MRDKIKLMKKESGSRCGKYDVGCGGGKRDVGYGAGKTQKENVNK